MKKLAIGIALSSLVSGCVATTDGEQGEFDTEEETRSIEQMVTSGTLYQFVVQHSGKCLDVSGSGTANGTNIQQWNCNGTNAQKFQTVATTGNHFKLVAQNSNKCVDVSGSGTGEGVNIQLWNCNGTSAQDFRFESSNGQFRMVNRNSNKCVDVAWASQADGTNIAQVSCNGSSAQTWATVAVGSGGGGGGGGSTTGSGVGSVLSSSTFQSMFPNRIAFYTRDSLVAAGNAYSTFVNNGDMTKRKRELAAFLANINHESDQLRAVREYNTANYCNYCDWSRPYGCPAGQCNYYGRGPMQLSWNFNYKTTGDAIGVNLVSNPDLVATDPTIAWKTAVHYWMTNSGPNTMTAHQGIECNDSWCGFGQTIRSINGALECDGRNPGAVEQRVQKYRQFCDMLGVSYGNNLYC